MATNEILPFAQGGGALVQAQVDYAADGQRLLGNQPGVARPDFVNKMLRQASIMSAGLAEYCAARQGSNVVDTLTPAQMAVVIREGFNPPGAIVTNTTGGSQSVSFSTWTVVELDNALENYGGWFDVATYRYTPQRAGYYILSAAAALSADSGSPMYGRCAFHKNGNFYAGGNSQEIPGTGKDVFTVSANAGIIMNGTTDYVDLRVYLEGTGTGETKGAGEDYCGFYCHLVRGT